MEALGTTNHTNDTNLGLTTTECTEYTEAEELTTDDTNDTDGVGPEQASVMIPAGGHNDFGIRDFVHQAVLIADSPGPVAL